MSHLHTCTCKLSVQRSYGPVELETNIRFYRDRTVLQSLLLSGTIYCRDISVLTEQAMKAEIYVNRLNTITECSAPIIRYFIIPEELSGVITISRIVDARL